MTIDGRDYRYRASQPENKTQNKNRSVNCKCTKLDNKFPRWGSRRYVWTLRMILRKGMPSRIATLGKMGKKPQEPQRATFGAAAEAGGQCQPPWQCWSSGRRRLRWWPSCVAWQPQCRPDAAAGSQSRHPLRNRRTPVERRHVSFISYSKANDRFDIHRGKTSAVDSTATDTKMGMKNWQRIISGKFSPPLHFITLCSFLHTSVFRPGAAVRSKNRNRLESWNYFHFIFSLTLNMVLTSPTYQRNCLFLWRVTKKSWRLSVYPSQL
jgi:hypothetical protein